MCYMCLKEEIRAIMVDHKKTKRVAILKDEPPQGKIGARMDDMDMRHQIEDSLKKIFGNK